ncbi:MAG: AMP-dependent synthetase/ligase [Acidimicrobiia bacterium]
MTSETTLRERKEIDAVVEGKTLVDIFKRNAERYPDQPAIHWKDGSVWKHLTWSQYRTRVSEAAAGLLSLGLGAGDYVAIMAGNRPEHPTSDLAAIHAGGTGVTIYSTLTADQIEYIANNCEAKVAVVEDLSFMKRWEEIKPNLPNLQHVVLMEGAENYATSDWVLSWDDLLEKGRALLASQPDAIEKATEAITPDTVATLIYTSGTTGVPKGVMITHRNVVWTAECVRRGANLPLNPRMVSYLPLAHIAERMSTHYAGVYLAGEVYYCPDLTEVLDYIQKARPQLFVAVPRVWEKFHARLMGRFEENEKRDLIFKALHNAVEVLKAEQAGRKPSFLGKAKMALFDKLVFSKVREQMGLDSVVTAITAAAPIDPEIIYFFQAIGVPLYELYGMSETTGPATSNRQGLNKIGTVGPALPGIEVKLAEDGEVLMRGGVITAGYYKMPQETAESFDADGWLHSGDLGAIDADGFLSIVGRKKEIIITAAGKNIAPAKLETIVKNNALISQACMIGDARKYLTMVLALDAEEAPVWAAANGIEYTDLATFAANPKVEAEMKRIIDEANEHVSRVEQVKQYHVVSDEWTPDSGEITPSLKLKRRVVLEKYADQIEAMYQE